MYCSSCGIDAVEGLKYCKRCGASLTTPESVPSKRPLALIALFLIVIAGIAALGLSLPLTMARELISIGFRTKEIIIFFFGSGAFTVIITRLLTRVLLKMIESQKHTGARLSHGAPYEQHQIGPPSSFGSVTENTTRSFERHRFDDARFEEQ
jgi:uncharacterized paraquat-inducible protein A